MDDETDVAGVIIDLAAAGLLAASAGWSGAVTSGWTAAVCASLAALGLSLAILHAAGRAGGRFRLTAFTPLAWGDAVTPRYDDKVVELFPVTPLPTPGEMQQWIDCHLQARSAGSTTPDTGDVVLLSADASAALRTALGELKRSLR
jgi:hypothetical protein